VKHQAPLLDYLASAPGKVSALVWYAASGKAPFAMSLALCVARGVKQRKEETNMSNDQNANLSEHLEIVAKRWKMREARNARTASDIVTLIAQSPKPVERGTVQYGVAGTHTEILAVLDGLVEEGIVARATGPGPSGAILDVYGLVNRPASATLIVT
jgi:hypothetical protein